MNDELTARLAVSDDKLDTLTRVKDQLAHSGVLSDDYVHPLDMDDLIERFEARHYSPHDDFLATCREVWSEMPISNAPNGDDIKTMAAIDTFARLFVKRYGQPIPHMCSHTAPPTQPNSRLSRVITSIRQKTGL